MLSCVFICAIIIFAVRDRFSVETIISNIENQAGFDIQLNDISKYVFYPSINFNNENVTISKKNIQLVIKKANINISKLLAYFTNKFKSNNSYYQLPRDRNT